ncbi:MAG: hypothetical protein JWR80_10073 [Bradyrhizobium sp.]|nr:hypothetical protein [Bradyrhizobium sp.]
MINPTFGLPDPNVALVDEGKLLTQPWYTGLIRLAQLSAERPIAPVSLGVSPYTFTATTIGDLLVRGGTVSAVTLVRGDVSVTCPTSGFIPMAANDSVIVTYSVLPTVTFVPRARA